MAIKTNLFKDDRVRLSPLGLMKYEFQNARTKTRVGTIVSNTLDPRTKHIMVHWDGNIGPNRRDSYTPDELLLYEEEEELVA